ncbi:hypothetical protein N665_0614s0003 [Sinapis alba]|nr:hypothetical protein N665_0614s0003 [Sinapis alba]
MAILLEAIIRSVKAFLKSKNSIQNPYVDPNLDPVLLVMDIVGSNLIVVVHESEKEECVWEEAHAHMQQMISETWDEMNYETQTANSSSSLSSGFVNAALNLGRMSQCIYQHGDGHGFPDKAKPVDCVMSLLVNPIP